MKASSMRRKLYCGKRVCLCHAMSFKKKFQRVLFKGSLAVENEFSICKTMTRNLANLTILGFSDRILESWNFPGIPRFQDFQTYEYNLGILECPRKFQDSKKKKKKSELFLESPQIPRPRKNQKKNNISELFLETPQIPRPLENCFFGFCFLKKVLQMFIHMHLQRSFPLRISVEKIAFYLGFGTLISIKHCKKRDFDVFLVEITSP